MSGPERLHEQFVNPEKQLEPKPAINIIGAVRQISDLYSGDRLATMLYGYAAAFEERHELWKEAVQTLPDFSEKITELRKTLDEVAITKNCYPESIDSVMGMAFSADDMAAQSLLADILWQRVTEFPGNIDYRLDVSDEADAMKRELGIQNEKQIKRIKLDTVVVAILVDQLKLTRQTKPKE